MTKKSRHLARYGQWGVSLHSNDPLAIKRLITERRFDPASSLHAEFGPFYFGIRQQSVPLGRENRERNQIDFDREGQQENMHLLRSRLTKNKPH